MAIDPVGGQLRWAPRSDQLGKQDIVVRLTDQYGQSFTQPYTLTARAENLPPMINSSANTAATVNKLYTYALRATDPEGGALSYSLVNTQPGNVAPPAGMTIDTATGLVRWTPATAGTYPITIQVTDDQGASVTQTYNLVVSATAASQPLVIIRMLPCIWS